MDSISKLENIAVFFLLEDVSVNHIKYPNFDGIIMEEKFIGKVF